MKVALKYCGHCNPQLDGPQLVAELIQMMPGTKFVTGEEGDILLVISGCPVDCATRPPHTGNELSIAGFNVNGQNVAKDNLTKTVYKQLLKLKQSL